MLRTLAFGLAFCGLVGLSIPAMAGWKDAIGGGKKKGRQCASLVIAKRIDVLGAEEKAEIQGEAREMGQQIIDASRDPSLKIDFRKTAEDLGREVEEIYGNYEDNKLLQTSLHDLKFSETTVKGVKVATLADVMNALHDMDGYSKGMQRGRILRDIPLLGNYLVTKTIDKMQTAQAAIGVMVQSLDKRKAALIEANEEIEKEIERNEGALQDLERSMTLAVELLAELKSGFAEAEPNSISAKNLEKYMKLLIERIAVLQELEMTGQTNAALYVIEMEHNEMGIKHIQRAKTVAIPVTIGEAIIQASGSRLELGLQTGDAIIEHNRQVFERIGKEITSQGARLRTLENNSLTNTTTIRNVLLAVEKEVEAQRTHDRQFVASREKVIAENSRAITRAKEVRQLISNQPAAQLTVNTDEFKEEIENMKQIADSSSEE